eukprot:1912655-Karenia_brevis.AAC.1
MLTAEADESGNAGVQLWVKTTIEVKIWGFVNPRLMYAVTRTSSTCVGFIVGHAPHSGATTDAKDAWWGILAETYRKLSSKYPIPWVCLLDANGRVGSVSSPAVGPGAPERENENGTRLREFAEEHILSLANTYGDNCGKKWTSSFGTPARIDYVIVQKNGLTEVLECGPDYDIDLTMNAWEDHNLVACVANFRNREHGQRIEKPFRVNKYNLANSERRELFQQLMWRFPHMSSEVHIDDHLEALNIFTRWAATVTFGSVRNQPKQ